MRINSLLLAALFLPRMALCAEPTALHTVGELSVVQSETILYDAKAKRAEALVKLQENANRAGVDLTQVRTTANAAPSVIASDLPTVTGVSGVGGRLYATLLYPNGTTLRSKSGEKLPGGFLVSEVSIDRVVLTIGDRRIPLQFGVATPPATVPQGAMQMPLPGMMAPPMPLR